MARAVSQQEFDQIASQPAPATPKRARAVSQEEFDRIASQNVPPPPAPTFMGEIGKTVSRGARMAGEFLGAGAEMAGQMFAAQEDVLRQYPAAMGPGAVPPPNFDYQRAAQQVQQNPTPNPLQGTYAAAQQQFQSNAPEVQPAFNAENTPYLGSSPLKQKAMRLIGEAGPAAATMAPVAVGGVLGGPAGAGAVGTLVNAAAQYGEALDRGATPDVAMREALIYAPMAGALDAIPFAEKALRFLPDAAAKSVFTNIAARGGLEGITEMLQGGASSIAEEDAIPKTADEFKAALGRAAQGVVDEGSSFVIAALMGGAMTAPTSVRDARNAGDRITLQKELQAGAYYFLKDYESAKAKRPPGQNPTFEDVLAEEVMRKTGSNLIGYTEPKLLGYRGRINADGSVMYEPESQRVPGDPAPEYPVGPGYAPITSAPSPYRSIEELSQNLPPQASPNVLPQRPMSAGQMAPIQQSEAIDPGVGVVPASPGSAEQIPAPPGEMPVIPSQEPFAARRKQPMAVAEVMPANAPTVQPFIGERPIEAVEDRMSMPTLRQPNMLAEPVTARRLTPAEVARARTAPESPVEPPVLPSEAISQPEATDTAPEQPEAVERPTATTQKQPWEMTREEYDADKPPLKPRESFVLNNYGSKTEAIQNPTNEDIARLSDAVRRKFPDMPKGDVKLRFTRDENGNEYVWQAHEGMHSTIEPMLQEIVGTELNQNAEKKPHRNVVYDALLNGKTIPQEVLTQYPEVIEAYNSTKKRPTAQFLAWQDRGKRPPIALYNIPVEGGGMSTVAADTARERGFDVPEPDVPAPGQEQANPQPEFPEMVREAQRWRGAAMNVASQLSEKKAILSHSRQTTKADLDNYLMRKFGVDATTARDVSNELTRLNLPDDRTAQPEDFAEEPWASRPTTTDIMAQRREPAAEGATPMEDTNAAIGRMAGDLGLGREKKKGSRRKGGELERAIRESDERFQNALGVAEIRELLAAEPNEAARKKRVGDWRSRFSDWSEMTASGDIVASDWEKASITKVPTGRLVEMIDSAIESGALFSDARPETQKRLSDYGKRRIEELRGEATGQQAAEPKPPKVPPIEQKRAFSPETQAIADAYGSPEKALQSLRAQKSRAESIGERTPPQTTRAIEELTLGGVAASAPTSQAQGEMFSPQEIQAPVGGQTEIIAEPIPAEYVVSTNEELADFRRRVRQIGVNRPTTVTWEDLGFHDTRPPAAKANGGRDWDQWLEDAYERGLIPEEQRSSPSALGDLLRGANKTTTKIQEEGVYVPGLAGLEQAPQRGGAPSRISGIMQQAGITRSTPEPPAKVAKQRKAKAAQPSEKAGELPAAPVDSANKQPWEMTLDEYIESELGKNRNKPKYEADPRALGLYKDIKENEWMEALYAQAEVDSLPLNVLDDYANRYGEQQLFRRFRGRLERGIAGWAPTDVRRVGTERESFYGFTDNETPLRAGAISKALSKQVRIAGENTSIRSFVDKSYESNTLSTSVEVKNKMTDEERAWLERHRQAFRNSPNKALEEKAKKEKTVYLVNGIDLGKTAYDYANHRLSQEKPLLESRISAPVDSPSAPAPQPGLTVTPVAEEGTMSPQERFDALKQRLDNKEITRKQFDTERDKIMKEIRASKPKDPPAKRARKKGDQLGAVNLNLPLDAARAVGRFLNKGKFAEFTHGLKGSKPLSVKQRAEMGRITKEAEQAVADVTNAFRANEASAGGVANRVASKFREMPDTLRVQINDYLAEPDKSKKQMALNALPENMRAPVKRLREIVDALSAQLLKTGAVSADTAKIIQSNMGHYLHRSYKIFKQPTEWKANIPDQFKENMRNLLRKQYSESRNDPGFNDMIETHLQDWMNPSVDADGNILFRGKKLGDSNKTALMSRNTFPKEVLDLWGVETDGILNFLETVKSAGQMLTNHKFLADTVKAGRGKYIFTKEDMAAVQKGTASPETIANYRDLLAQGKLVPATESATLYKNTEPSAGKLADPLKDTYVDKDFLEALENAVKVQEYDPTIATLIEINSMAKMMKTVYSPTSSALNFTSNFGFAFANGWMTYYNPAKTMSNMKKALDIAGTEVKKHTHKPSHRALANEARGLGVIGDTDTASELEASYESTKRGKIRNIGTRVGKQVVPPALRRALGGTHSLATSMYQAGDDFFKAFGWITRTNILMDNGMPEAEAKEQAALYVRAVLPTYSETHKIVKAIRDIPFVGNFPTFVSEVPRNSINTLQQIQKDFRTPGMRKAAINASVGTIAALAFTNVGKAIGMAALGLDDEDEETIMTGVPEWDKNSAFMWTSQDRANGIFEGTNLSRQSPFSVMEEPVLAALRADGLFEGIKKGVQTALEPYTDEEIAYKALVDWYRNRDGYGNKIYLDSDTNEEAAKKVMAHLWKGIEPGAVSSVRRAMESENPGKKLVQSAIGLRTQRVDLPEQLMFAAINYSKSAREPYRDVRRAATGGDRENYDEQVRQLREADEQGFNKLHEMVAGMEKLGVDRIVIMDALEKAGMRRGGREMKLLLRGVYREPRLSRSLEFVEGEDE